MYAFLLWVLQKSFALQDELVDNIPLRLKLVQFPGAWQFVWADLLAEERATSDEPAAHVHSTI